MDDLALRGSMLEHAFEHLFDVWGVPTRNGPTTVTGRFERFPSGGQPVACDG
jgi:hypothetical protein